MLLLIKPFSKQPQTRRLGRDSRSIPLYLQRRQYSPSRLRTKQILRSSRGRLRRALRLQRQISRQPNRAPRATGLRQRPKKGIPHAARGMAQEPASTCAGRLLSGNSFGFRGGRGCETLYGSRLRQGGDRRVG